MSDGLRTVQVRIEGRVQGVGYRVWTQRVAAGLGLEGWVRNRRDGSVEAVFQGTDAKVADMIERCRTGPSGSAVTRVDVMGEGVGVFTGFTVLLFEAIGIRAEWLAQGWLIPCGAMGAVLVGSWLVEAKQSVIENMAPVLTRLFTPLFTIMLLAFLGTMAWTGRPIDVKREVLIACDLLLAVVVGLVVYAASARDPQAPPDLFDALQLLLVASALVVDAITLTAIAARISEFGFTPNRVAALGENLILLVNLVGTAWLYARFLRGRGSFASLERWQVAYLPVYAAWAALVVIVFPPLFGFR